MKLMDKWIKSHEAAFAGFAAAVGVLVANILGADSALTATIGVLAGTGGHMLDRFSGGILAKSKGS